MEHDTIDALVEEMAELKAGARNNAEDQGRIQTIHNLTLALGAKCEENLSGVGKEDDDGRSDDKKKALSDLGLGEKEQVVAERYLQGVTQHGSGITVQKTLGVDDLFVRKVMGDHLIVADRFSGNLYKIAYNDGLEFSSPTPVEARLVFEPVGEEQKAETASDPSNLPSNDDGTPTLVFEPGMDLKAAGVEFDASEAMSEAGTELKSVYSDDDIWVVGNHMIRYGNPQEKDLEGITTPRQNPDGTIGEYFVKGVQWESEFTERGYLDMDFEHGRDADPLSPGRDDVLGYVDVKSITETDMGLWAMRVLNRQNQYVAALKTLSDRGLIRLGSSTEPVQTETAKAEDGGITRWPLYRDSLTVTPMEFRQITDGGELEEVKSALSILDEVFPGLKAVSGIEVSDEVVTEEGETDEPAGAGGELEAERERLLLETDVLDLSIRISTQSGG